jgi:hypothetical protein
MPKAPVGNRRSLPHLGRRFMKEARRQETALINNKTTKIIITKNKKQTDNIKIIKKKK